MLGILPLFSCGDGWIWLLLGGSFFLHCLFSGDLVVLLGFSWGVGMGGIRQDFSSFVLGEGGLGHNIIYSRSPMVFSCI